MFRLQGAAGLRAELDKDVARLWKRNLGALHGWFRPLRLLVAGRDDRLVSDSGREARHPYLDEQFASFVRSLPLDLVCDLSLPPGACVLVFLSEVPSLAGAGDKRILRLAAPVWASHVRARWSNARCSSAHESQTTKVISLCQHNLLTGFVAVSGEVSMDDSVVLAEIVHPALLTVSLPRGPSRLPAASASEDDDAVPAAATDESTSGTGSGPGFVRDALSKKVKRRQRHAQRDAAHDRARDRDRDGKR